MPISRTEIESPMLYDWVFIDEKNIELDLGRFIVPNIDEQTIVARMARHVLNDGRAGVIRTESYYGVEPRELTFQAVPYNLMCEIKYRVGVRFRMQDHVGDYLWAVLESVRVTPERGYAWSRTEMLYTVSATFSQTSPF